MLLLRIGIFICLLLALIGHATWLSVLLFAWYICVYTGYELVVLALLIDGYYGAFFHVPWLTIVVFGLFIMVTLTKERLLLYTHKDEILP